MFTATSCGRWIVPLLTVLTMLSIPLVLLADGSVGGKPAPATAPSGLAGRTATAHTDDRASLNQIAAAIGRLSSPSHAERDKASAFLWNAGPKAVPALREAARSSDTEVATRAKDILDQFSLGILPDIPENVRKLVQRIRTDDETQRQQDVADLVQMGPEALGVLAALVEHGMQDQRIYWQLHTEAGNRLSQTIPQLIGEGADDAKIRHAFDLGLAMQDEDTVVGFAAWCISRGKLDEAMLEFAPMEETRPLVLIRLHQAKGNAAKARDLARKYLPLEAMKLALDHGDWNEALALVERNEEAWQKKYDLKGLTAACHRLLGNKVEFARSLDKLATTDVSVPAAGPDTNAYLINEAFEPAVKQLVAHDSSVDAANLLIEQCSYDQAMRLVEKLPRKPRADDAEAVANRIATAGARATLMFLQGRIDEGMKLTKEIETKQADEAYLSQALQVYKTVGMAYEARRCARQLLRIGIDRDPLVLSPTSVTQSSGFEVIYPARCQETLALARMLKQAFPKDGLDALLEKIDLILSAKPDSQKLKAIVDKVPADYFVQFLEDLRSDDILTEDINYCFSLGGAQLLVAKACRSAGMTKASEDYIKGLVKGMDYLQSQPFMAATLWKGIADIYAEAGLWPQAYENYLRASKLWPSDGEYVFLAGLSAQRSGKTDEGKRLMDRGALMILVNRSELGEFVAITYRYDLPQARQQMFELVLRTGGPEYLESAGGWDWYIQQLEQAGQYAKAAAAWERIRLSYLSSTTYVPGVEPILKASQQLHKELALAAIARRDFDAAMAEAQTSLSAWRTRMEGSLPDMLAALEKAGRKDLTQTLYAQAKGCLDDLLKRYPRSPRLLNDEAWLLACCHRDLPQALTLAQECVKLAPEACMFDTLSEIQFQLGNPTAALATAEKAMELDDGSDPYFIEYMRQQYVRLRKGDPQAAQIRVRDNPPGRNFGDTPEFPDAEPE